MPALNTNYFQPKYAVVPLLVALAAYMAYTSSPRAAVRSTSGKMSLSSKLAITDVDLKGKRVLIRVDFNVPQDKTTSEITNPARIVAALPTIQYAIDHGT